LNTWYHIAFVRNGSAATLYINGVSAATASGFINGSTGGGTYIGNESGGTYYFNGYISNLRIVSGVVVYGSAFTLPRAPLTLDYYSTQTSLLLNTVAWPPLNLKDSSPNNFTVTPTGSPLPSELNPF
jgi:hypothetical protein